MSLFKKIFGTRSFDEMRRAADELFDAERFEDARIAYDDALERKKGAPADGVEHCEERLGECLDKMAEARIAEAQRMIEEGDYGLAETELANAMEMASSPKIVKRARKIREDMEKRDAKEQTEVAELSDDDRWMLLSGNWSEDQLEEYDSYGEELRAALIALHKGEAEPAHRALEAILEEAEEPVYLYLPVGRARIAVGDDKGGAKALRRLIKRLDEGQGTGALLAARFELAALAEQRGDAETTIAELQAAMDEVPEDPRPFYALGSYLRRTGQPGEAIEVLEAALPLLDELQPDPAFFEELGLAYADDGDDEKAEDYLTRVVQVRVDQRQLDYPVATAVALAALYERTERPEKAVDMWRSLANGSDVANHLKYHFEAGRLLAELDLEDEARRMYTRALALAEGNAEETARIEAALADLG